MTYRVIAIDGGATHVVGDYPDYRAALRARADDVLARLETLGWSWTRLEHEIVGPGLDGPQTVHPVCTQVGVDRTPDGTVSDADVDDVRNWLLAVHELEDADHIG